LCRRDAFLEEDARGKSGVGQGNRHFYSGDATHKPPAGVTGPMVSTISRKNPTSVADRRIHEVHFSGFRGIFNCGCA
jgi:hypothetical protein